MTSELYRETIASSLEYAKKNNYQSLDLSDLKKTRLYRHIQNNKSKLVRYAASIPYELLIKYRPNWLRLFIREKGYVYPQAQAMIVRALIQLAIKGDTLGDLSEVQQELQWLKKARNTSFPYAGWGQPFLWYSEKPFPENIPRATVSSQVAWAFLDMFEITEDEEYLAVAEEVCKLFIHYFSHEPDSKGNICFSYTTEDDYRIHNASMLAASVLARVYKYKGISEYADYAIKATDFTVHHQNRNGSFGYAAPPAQSANRYDNYHTGFVLESLYTIKQDLPESRFNRAYECGMDFYQRSLFDDDRPKYTDQLIYPIDIQSCAQAIITFGISNEPEHKAFAKQVAEYSIKNFFLPEKNHFAYRIYKNGFKDESYYFRWGDAWMIRALSYLTDDFS